MERYFGKMTLWLLLLLVGKIFGLERSWQTATWQPLQAQACGLFPATSVKLLVQNYSAFAPAPAT